MKSSIAKYTQQNESLCSGELAVINENHKPMKNFENHDLRLISGQVSFLQTLMSIIGAEGKVVLTRRDSRRLDQIAQTINSMKLFVGQKADS